MRPSFGSYAINRSRYRQILHVLRPRLDREDLNNDIKAKLRLLLQRSMGGWEWGWGGLKPQSHVGAVYWVVGRRSPADPRSLLGIH